MWALLLALVCVAANAFFVAAEFALAKVRPTSLEALARGGDPSAARAYKITQRLDAYLSATQLGITLASLGLGWVGEPALARMITPIAQDLGLSPTMVRGVSFAIAFGTLSILHIVVGELVPKSIAIQRPEQVSRLSSRPLRFFFVAAYPALWVLNGASNFVLRLLGLPAPEHAEGKLSLEELRLVIQASFESRGLEGKKRELLERVLRATDRPVRAVMVPRVDMKILSLDDDFETSMKRVRRFGFSRYPVAEADDPDRVVGYVYVKDLLMAVRPPRGSIGELKRDILYVPETRTVGDLLGEFQSSKIHIALVVDEYGGTSGLLTLEDVVEEIVGDIEDELEVGEARVRVLEGGTIVVDGSLPIDELMVEGLSLPPAEGADTVGGYVLAHLGRLAHPGDRIEVGDYELLVQDVRERRVHRVAFLPREVEPADAT